MTLASTLKTVRATAFDGGWNLPLWVAQEHGFFANRGLNVLISYASNSALLLAELASGKQDIALAAADNFIAYSEGQVARTTDSAAIRIVMGGDGGFLSLVAAPGIDGLADLAGRRVSVDSMSTGFAFVLRELLARAGLTASDVAIESAGGTSSRYGALIAGHHAATLLRTPYELQARAKGFVRLAGTESIGAYHGTVGAVREDWAREHASVVVAFLRGYRDAMDWLADARHHPAAQALLASHIPGLGDALAADSLALLLAPGVGLRPDLSIDTRGLKTVLGLRSQFGEPRRHLTDTARYVDHGFLEQAFAGR